jgi:hypothetical protein
VDEVLKVLCIDPGPHVGVATWTNEAKEALHDEDEFFMCFEQTPAELYGVADAWIAWADAVVCEGFVISGQRAKEANVTVEMIGVLRYLSAKAGKPFVVQPPGAFRFAGSDKLKRLGWYRPGPDHARSAAGHLVKFLAERNLIDAARLLPSAAEGGA